MSCNLCHDPHGISATQGNSTNNPRLLNFDSTYCFPEENSGVLEFVDLGDFHGSCTMFCHGKNHENKTY